MSTTSQDPRPQEFESRGEMHVLEHLSELRKRLIYSFIAVGISAVLAFIWSAELFSFLALPFRESFNETPLIGTGPAEAFILRLKVSAFAGLLISSPVIFWQIWQFIAPGLHSHEKRLALPFLVGTTFLFLSGVAFCFFVVFPFAFEFFFGQFQILAVEPTIRISEYLTFSMRVLLAFGIVFEMPILAFFLGRLGLLTDKLLISWTRYAVVVIFLVAAILTPPDVITQFLMAGPLLLLYGVSILIVRVVQPQPEENNNS